MTKVSFYWKYQSLSPSRLKSFLRDPLFLLACRADFRYVRFRKQRMSSPSWWQNKEPQSRIMGAVSGIWSCSCSFSYMDKNKDFPFFEGSMRAKPCHSPVQKMLIKGFASPKGMQHVLLSKDEFGQLRLWNTCSLLSSFFLSIAYIREPTPIISIDNTKAFPIECNSARAMSVQILQCHQFFILNEF